MAYKGNHRDTPQAAQKRAETARPSKSGKSDVYTVNGVPVVPVRFTGFGKYQPNPADTTTSAN